MTISRGQMYRQLYMSGGIGSLDAGAPSIKYEGDIRPQMTSAPDPMDALNDLAMQLFGKPLDRLTPSERQALDEYNSGMMAVGGRVNYGIGSKLKKFAKKVIDPVAQVAAFIPGVHQPFAQGYTALRASGVGGDNYGGLQVLGMTPGAGQFQPYGQQGGFRIQDFIPTFDATNPATGESIFGPGGKLKPNASTSSIFETGIGNKMKEIFNDAIYYPSKEEIEKRLPGKKVSQGLLDLVKKVFVGEDGKNIPNTTAATAGAVLAKLSYDQQKALEERLRGEYEAYQSGASRFRERMGDKSKLRGYEVTGIPRTVKDVVRAPAMGGGIMDSRMMYASGSEDLEYKGWKRIYLKSNDAAESHPRHLEFIKRFAEETMGQDRSPEVRIKKAVGGDLSEPMSSFELQNLRAGPDWYIKRIEALMYEYDMDYDTAAEIAFDSDKYFELMPDGLAKGGRPGYAMGNTAQMAAQAEGLPLRNNQVGITELDLRDSGGFIPPVGIKEKADDIPAMLSNNEFVFTADAVRGMGDGNVDVGAQRMYDIMKKLEKGGRV
jgi:hypothetical protein